jgi:hypothetical protein
MHALNKIHSAASLMSAALSSACERLLLTPSGGPNNDFIDQRGQRPKLALYHTKSSFLHLR